MVLFSLSVGNLADLIFVFFDPIGQALCKRTLNLVGKLHAANLITHCNL